MKKLSAIFLAIGTFSLLISSCEEENCPPNALAYAVFALSDQYGNPIQFSNPISIIGQIETDVVVNDTLEDGSIHEITKPDSIINDTIINQESAAEHFKLPLSYDSQTRFIIAYNETTFDTITVTHQNIPHFISMECGTGMYHHIDAVRCAHRIFDSITIVNPDVTYDTNEHIKVYLPNN